MSTFINSSLAIVNRTKYDYRYRRLIWSSSVGMLTDTTHILGSDFDPFDRKDKVNTERCSDHRSSNSRPIR